MTDSFQTLWKTIQNDTIPKEKKLHYLEIYIKKAHFEKHILEEYRGLEKKSFLVSYQDAVELLKKMKPLVDELSNDSLSGRFLNISTGLYYSNRSFKEALDYAIQSEIFNEETDNLYNLNSVRIDIGNIYYHTRNYEKAVHYFSQAKNYYKSQKDYNHRRAYVVTLYSLGKGYWQLGTIDSLISTIEESDQAIPLLKQQHQVLEKAYLAYVKGGLSFLQKDYSTAKNYFNKALPVIQQNEDVTNEYVLYLYLGKIAWLENKKSEAVHLFNKIDELFHRKKFLNYELREAYEYLIAYYKETNQPQLQLQATESLILLNQQFEKEQQNITNTLHSELDNKKLEQSKKQLQNQLNTNKSKYSIGLIVLGTVLLVVSAYSFWQDREKKKLRLKFNELLSDLQQQKFIEPEEVKKVDIAKEISRKDPKVASNLTEKRLLHKLELFEQQKGYLKAVKLDDLAEEFGTNRSTLSIILNKYKGGFTNYINKLRIHQLLIDLTDQADLRQHAISELAENYGFTNVKTLTNQFKTETGLTPSYFIKQLELNFYNENN